MRGPAAALLAFEAVVVLLAGLLLASGSAVGDAMAWVLAGGLTVLCIVGAATMRRGPGWLIGSIVQVLVLAGGFLEPTLFILGAAFGGLWIMAYMLDRRLQQLAAARG